jgi:hypothetical protein
MARFSFKKAFSNAVKRIASNPVSTKITGRTDLFQNFQLFNNTPTFINTSTIRAYFDVYSTNPVFYSAVNIIAKAESTVKVQVWNKQTDELEPESTNDKTAKKIYKLFKNPNPLQSKRELFYQKSIFYNVAGNSYLYGNVPEGFNIDISTIQTLVNIWPQYMTYVLAGGYFDALEISDIIKNWIFDASNFQRTFKPKEILHQNYPNTDFQSQVLGSRTNLISGQSVIETLRVPLSNIMLAYESRNVIIKNRGMRAILSSDRGDATGKLPMQPEDRKLALEEIKNYGTLEDQNQFLLTTMPLKVDIIDQDVRKLGLFDEIVHDGMIVSNALDVPTDLLKLALQGVTYENQDASMKRLYQDNVIPKAKEDFDTFNTWFGLNDTKWEIRGSFAHLPVLQADQEKAARANRQRSAYMKELFEKGAVTHNMWLTEVGLQTYEGGDKRIWEFEESQLDVILNRQKENVTI